LIVASLPASRPSADGLTFRVAGAADLPQLASWNQELINDEGHDNTMSLDELVMRMRTWLATEYQALIFDEPATPADPALLESRWIPACAGMTAAGSVPAAQERIPACAEMTAAASAPVAYALFRDAPEWIHLRQFFVARARRRRGIGARAVALLRDTVFARDKPVIVEAMAWNQPALSFWRAVGFADRYVGLESRPEGSVQRSSRNVPS
jgi:GNAT superfamily N-acetyltransferase